MNRTCSITALLLALATTARADVGDDLPPTTNAPAGEYAVLRGVQGPAGMFSARILLDVNLSAGQAGKPISLAPDLFYSFTDRFQLGLVHQGPEGWQTRPGTGLCLTGASNGCPHVYDNIGFDALYVLVFGKLDLSAHASLFFDSFDPTREHLALGFAGKAHLSDRVAVAFDPKYGIALDDRATNDDYFIMPVELDVQAAPKTSVKLLTGLFGNVSSFSDSYQIPVGIGLVQNLNAHFDLGARFSFDNLLGNEPMGVGRVDDRSLAVLLNIRS